MSSKRSSTNVKFATEARDVVRLSPLVFDCFIAHLFACVIDGDCCFFARLIDCVVGEQRYKYLQPGFSAGMEKPFSVPGPNAYNTRDVVPPATNRGNRFGASGRSPVGIVYS